jgi:hypothetical protein
VNAERRAGETGGLGRAAALMADVFSANLSPHLLPDCVTRCLTENSAPIVIIHQSFRSGILLKSNSNDQCQEPSFGLLRWNRLENVHIRARRIWVCYWSPAWGLTMTRDQIALAPFNVWMLFPLRGHRRTWRRKHGYNLSCLPVEPTQVYFV